MIRCIFFRYNLPSDGLWSLQTKNPTCLFPSPKPGHRIASGRNRLIRAWSCPTISKPALTETSWSRRFVRTHYESSEFHCGGGRFETVEPDQVLRLKRICLMDTPTRCALRTEFLGGDYSARSSRCESQGRRFNETSFLFVSTSLPPHSTSVSTHPDELVKPWGEKVPQSAGH